METEENDPREVLKEFQNEIAKQFGMAALARLDAQADRIIAPHKKDDTGKLFLAYLALKAGAVVTEE